MRNPHPALPRRAKPKIPRPIAEFDLPLCTEIMLEEVRNHVAARTQLTDVYFVLFDPRAHQISKTAWEKVFLKE
ncbi:MAG: hypothetical protein ACYSTL_06945 [Planctomycetota bacterium]